jgi:L-ascorbate metabolism protein UlaG (beta-lactamase superfamily)
MAGLAATPYVSLPKDFAGPGPDGVVSLWWLEQAGFALRAGETRIAIDPYLSDSLAAKYAGTRFPHRRMAPPPVAPDALRRVDVVLCTHAHTDHMDPGTLGPLAAANPECLFVVPAPEVAKAVERGVPMARAVPAEAGRELTFPGGLSLLPLPAAHEEFSVDEAGRHRFLGYRIAWAGRGIYHSGDCVPYSGLADALAALRIDLALLPVNGRDEIRRSAGVPGNFTLAEAASLCREAGIPMMLGHHYGLFDFNTIDEEAARRSLAGEVGAALVERGVRYDLA